MINSYWKDLKFAVHETNARPWRRMIDTSLESPDDFREPGTEVRLGSPEYVVPARSIVVLTREA